MFIFVLSQYNDQFGKKLTIKGNSIDGVLGTQTLDHRMVGLGTDESTELLRPIFYFCLFTTDNNR